MALTPEDKADVKGAMGKALANKVSKVTKDKGYPGKISKHFADLTGKHHKKSDTARIGRGIFDLAEGNYVKLKPTSSASEGHKHVTAFSPYKPGSSSPTKYTDAHKALKSYTRKK